MFKTANKYGHANFIRKPTSEDLIPKTMYVIEKTVYLESEQFLDFIANPLADRDFIKENKDLMYEDAQGVWHCILVTASGYEFGVLIESEGYSYARYAAYIKLDKEDK